MTTLKLIALVLTAFILIPGGAHLFELPGKIDLPRDAYFTVQGIYAGWALFAVPIFAALIANAMLFYLMRRRRVAEAGWALGAAVLILAGLVVFFAFVFPGNRETLNWTAQPENWEALRFNWESGHAANAILTFLAFLCTARAAVGP